MSDRCIPEWIAAALMPLLRRWSTWSFISEIRGVMTRHTPSIASAGTWKVIDFPPPVGISPRVSFPAPMLSMISRWMPLKSG